MYSCDRAQMKRTFDEIISSRDVSANSALLSREKYLSLIEELKQAHAEASYKRKTPRQKRLTKRYDIIQVRGVYRLTFPDPFCGSPAPAVKFYICSEELFDTLYETHIALYHAGRDRMYQELQQKYKNITQCDIVTFLNCCEHCLRMKMKKPSQSCISTLPVTESVEETRFNSRGIVDLIDYRHVPDDGHHFVLIYRDNATQFTIIRPLKILTEKEVATQLLDVFLTIGAPSILHSTVSREFTWNVIQKLKEMWPELRMVHGKVAEKLREIRPLIFAELIANGNKWKDRLGFVQFKLNKTHTLKMKCTPYKATFGSCAQVGFAASPLGQYAKDNIESEEEFRCVMYGKQVVVAVEKTDDEGVTCDLKCTCGRDVSGDACEFCAAGEEPDVKRIKVEADDDLCMKEEYFQEETV